MKPVKVTIKVARAAVAYNMSYIVNNVYLTTPKFPQIMNDLDSQIYARSDIPLGGKFTTRLTVPVTSEIRQ